MAGGGTARLSGELFFLFFVFSFSEWRLLPGMGGRSPARRGAWGERGRPLYTPCTPVLPFWGNAESVFFIGLYPVRRVSRGRRREPSPACGRGDVRACCGAPSALRASGIAFAPAPSLHQRQRRKGGALSGNEGRRASGRDEPGGSGGGKPADGGVFSSRSWGKEAPVSRRVKRPFLDGEGRPLCGALFGRHSPLLCVSAFSKLKCSRAFSVCSVSHPKPYGLSFRGKSARFFRLLLAGRRCAARHFAFFDDKMLKQGTCLTVSRQSYSLFLSCISGGRLPRKVRSYPRSGRSFR